MFQDGGGWSPTMRKRTYDVDLNKLVGKIFKFLRNHDVPKHWSKTKNEKYDVHLMNLYIFPMLGVIEKSLRLRLRLPSVQLSLPVKLQFSLWNSENCLCYSQISFTY